MSAKKPAAKPKAVESYVCCYCEKRRPGKPKYFVPAGFATHRAHDRKPLCAACGAYPEPTLDQICLKLDLQAIADAWGEEP